MKGDAGNTGRADRGAARTPAAALPCVMKLLAPEVMAAAIIGKGGAVIASIRQSCSARVALTEHGEVYPGTDCRIITVQASTEDQINEVARQIISKVLDLATSAGPSEAIGTEGELKLRALVPRAAVGGLIGKGGAAIKQLREISGAKVSISEPFGTGPSAEQLVSLVGAPKALEHVLTEVNHQIAALNEEPWFSSWASTNGSAPGGAGGYSELGGAGRSSGGRGGYQAPGIDTMIRVAQGLPPYVMEDSRGFALSCVVPNRLVGGLIGRGGAGTKEVQSITNARISIREIPDDPENRSLNIAGPLSNTCAAYMLMMKRYLDAEAAASSSTAPGR